MEENKKYNYKFIDLFLQMLDCYEFQLHYAGDIFFVEDMQRGNLGNIEAEVFDNLQQLCDRMEAYHNDYLYKAVEEDQELSVWDLASIYLVENSDNLEDCNVEMFKQYLKENNISEDIYEETYVISYPSDYQSSKSLSYWYGEGDFCIYSKYGRFDIDAIGDVCCSLYAKRDFKDIYGIEHKKGEELAYVKDKNNAGLFKEHFENYINNDSHLIRLLSDDDKDIILNVGNNNWLNISYIDKNGNIKTIEDFESLYINDAIKFIEDTIKYKEQHKDYKIFEDLADEIEVS